MTAQVPDYLDPAQALRADPLNVARTAARDGKRVVGYVGNDVPVALICAANALPVRLRGDARVSTARARPLPRKLVPRPGTASHRRTMARRRARSSMQWSSRERDDSGQRLYYYLCELQRRGLCGGPRPLLYDVADIGRPSSTGYTRESTRRLAQELGTQGRAVGGRHPASRAARFVVSRDPCSSLLRRRRWQAVLGWRVNRASAGDWREVFDDATRRWLMAAPGLSGPRRSPAGWRSSAR